MALGLGQRLARAGKLTVAVLGQLISPQLSREDLADAIGYVENAGAPTSVVPDFIGQKLFDTDNSNFYIAYGTSSGNWALLGDSALSLAELAYLDAVTAGTVAASKAVVVDSNKDVGTLRNLRATRLIASGGTPTSDATAGGLTVTAAMLLTGIIVRDPSGGNRTDTFDTAANIVAAIPGATVGDTICVRYINGADAAETITIAAGSGGGFDTNQTATSRVIAQNTAKDIRIRLTNVTAASEAYVIYC